MNRVSVVVGVSQSTGQNPPQARAERSHLLRSRTFQEDLNSAIHAVNSQPDYTYLYVGFFFIYIEEHILLCVYCKSAITPETV